MNQVNGLLFVANVQGASWDRRRRRFVTHQPAPPTLQASLGMSHTCHSQVVVSGRRAADSMRVTLAEPVRRPQIGVLTAGDIVPS